MKICRLYMKATPSDLLQRLETEGETFYMHVHAIALTRRRGWRVARVPYEPMSQTLL